MDEESEKVPPIGDESGNLPLRLGNAFASKAVVSVTEVLGRRDDSYPEKK